jgi:tetratricopeptide (TPR) repeat protein
MNMKKQNTITLRAKMGTESKRLRTAIISCAITAIFLCGLFVPVHSQKNINLQFLTRLNDAGSKLASAINQSDPTQLSTVKTLYAGIRKDLEANPELMRQMSYAYDACEYELGMCGIYQYEFTGEPGFLSEAQQAFEDFAAGQTPDSVGLLGTYMAAETRFLQAEREQYMALNALSSHEGNLGPIRARYSESQQLFAKVAQHADHLAGFVDSSALRACALTRIADIVCEQARLALGEGDAEAAKEILESADYAATRTSLSSADSVSQYLRYSSLIVRQDLAMLKGNDTVLLAIRDSTDVFGNLPDRKIRYALATLAADTNLQSVIDLLNSASGSTGTPEVSYWLGCAYLLSGDFDNARNAFDLFLTASDENDARLVPLRQRAHRISTIVGFAEGKEVSLDDIKPLNYDDVKIILRIIRMAPGRESDKAIRIIEPIFNDPGLFTWGEDERRFCRGILLSIQGETQRTPAERAPIFRIAADSLRDISGVCAPEAQYIRARDLFFARDSSEAKPLLRDLVNDFGSARALYYLAEIYRGDSCANAVRCYTSLLAALDSKSEFADFEFWNGNAQAGEKACQGQGLGALNGLDLSKIRYPDYLSFLSPEEAVTYETLADIGVIRAKIASETIRQYLTRGFPKLILHPGPRPGRMAVLNRYWPAFNAPVPIMVPLNEKWNLCLKLVGIDDRQGIAAASIVSGDSSLPYENGCYHKADIGFDKPVVAQISHDGYYRMDDSIPAQLYGDYDTTLAMAKIVSYSRSSQTTDKLHVYRRDSLDFDIVLIDAAKVPVEAPADLIDAFMAGIAVRDFAYDPVGRRFLAVDSSLNAALRVYAVDGRPGISSERLTLNFGSATAGELASPEGIAVDAEGNIYIADWGNHCVIVFDNQGDFIKEFGEFGKNALPNSGEQGRLVFPTRIAIEEDFEGIGSSSGEPPFRHGHILVADRYGIHKFDASGNYLDSPLTVETSEHPAGSFYAFTVSGYGPSSVIRIIDRLTGDISFFAVKK